MWHLSHRPSRYGELKRLIPEITKKMLAQSLRELEEHGFVSRTQETAGNLISVQYDLTEYGRQLTPMLQLISEWGVRHHKKLQGIL
ncbi:winged helix-turn-helix transcriptional regulator [Paenibacillus thermotolerans]|uniref:winged helix-turn-helix transcriptional regulator n=1 Tax=Paenibacillus thermotolerans TaxID=3027807 RepID=UPI0023679E2F|nr:MULTISPECIES: helix-turn-helix domain-containing protein [unclassified Paenibacillus]